jgi:hypothetical protein
MVDPKEPMLGTTIRALLFVGLRDAFAFCTSTVHSSPVLQLEMSPLVRILGGYHLTYSAH